MTPAAIDPVMLEVVRNKLDDIADEMEITLLKTSHSAIVKEALDASAALFDPSGQQIAQATAAPIHLGMIIPAVQRFVEVFPPHTMNEGDVYILNDPFDGGTHLPDIVMTVPVIVDGEVVALSTAITHHQEMGGRSPGSTPMDATEIYQEGLRIPPLKLYDRGVQNDTFLAMLARNVRIPDAVIGDVHGQLTACQVGRRGILKLVERYGKADLRACMAELLDRAERLTRASVEEIPDGTYEFVDYLDPYGLGYEEPIEIRVKVTIDGARFIVDMTGTAPQVAAPLNCVPASTLSAIYYVLKVATDPTIPNNAGCYRPVEAILPPGSIVNATEPAACNGRSVVVRRTVDALLGALTPALRGKLPAASNGHPLVMLMGGVDSATGSPYVTAEIGTGGMGGRPGKDGLETIQTDTSNSQNVPVEAIELETPIRVGYYRLRQDSGGAGEFRGGLGFEKQFEVLRGELRLSHRGERHSTAPWGVFGGEPGATAHSLLVRADGTEHALPSKLDFTMTPGDRLDIFMSGGGGYGDPFTRDPQAVLRDVVDGKCSLDAAADRYGVIVVDGEVDEDGTLAQRTRLAAARGDVTWTYDRGALGRE